MNIFTELVKDPKFLIGTSISLLGVLFGLFQYYRATTITNKNKSLEWQRLFSCAKVKQKLCNTLPGNKDNIPPYVQTAFCSSEIALDGIIESSVLTLIHDYRISTVECVEKESKEAQGAGILELFARHHNGYQKYIVENGDFDSRYQQKIYEKELMYMEFERNMRQAKSDFRKAFNHSDD